MTSFALGNGAIWNGDCLELMKYIPSGSVDMILCDLPYGTTHNKWDTIIPFAQLWEQYWRIAKPNAAIVLTAQPPFDKKLGCSQIEFLKYEWIWKKEAGTGFLNAKKQPLKNCENVLIFYKQQAGYNPQMVQGGKPYKIKGGKGGENYNKTRTVETVSNGERYPTSLLEFQRDKDKIHPTQKPVALFEYLIKTYTNPGETALDNCSGSGTTAIAAQRTGRRFLCIEKDPVYYYGSTARLWKEVNGL